MAADRPCDERVYAYWPVDDEPEQRPRPPRRRLEATLTISADSITDLVVHLMQLGTELCTEEGVPESVNRYTVTGGATSHLLVGVDADQTAERYQAQLREWARGVLRTHVRADHRAAAADGTELF